MMLSLEARDIELTQLLGPGAPSVLEEAGLPLPPVMTVHVMDEGFIARTGKDEFLIQGPDLSTAGRKLAWTYPRGDRVLALQGDAWREAMAQICHWDFSDFKEGEWQMLAAAGITIWCLGSGDGLLLGCDPSLGDYLQGTLAEIVNDLNAFK
jgi:hypothetical protein